MGAINLARAAASPLVRGRPSSPPDVVLSGTTRADPEQLHAYARACGFPPRATMPPTFPHVLAFDLVMRLMSRRDFPFALPGLIHIRNAITVRRRISPGETLSLRVRAGKVAEHPKGHTVDVLTLAGVGREPCWSERSTYLHRDGTQHQATAASERTGSLPAVATWDLPGALGRRFARVSGDWNPIHLSLWTARPFGFRRPIAHGMWTMARALSAMDTLADAFTVDVTFAAPLLLPSRVEFASDGERLAVRPANAAADARPHLTGTVTRQ